MQKITLHLNDRLMLFTDGVVEAFNPQDEEYDIERTMAAARLYASQPVTAWVHAVIQAVNTFMGEAPQSDDLTVLAFRFKGPALSSSSGKTIG